jgi:hypothetical protein
MRDAWQDLLRRLSGPHASFTFGEVARWKQTDFQALCDLDLLSDGEPASHLLCPECSGHWAEATWTNKGTRAFIVCTREGRPVDVDPEHLRQWEPNKERLVALVAAGLGITDRALNLVAGQLWRLGRCTVARRQRDVFFAAIAPEDLSPVVTEIRRGYGSVAGILLLPSCAPDPGENSKLRIVDLSNAIALRRDRIVVNLPFIEEQFKDDHHAGSEGSRLKGPVRTLKSHRMGILKAYAPNRNFKGLAQHLGVCPSALYGMVRDDRTRFSQDKLELVLSKINCSRTGWDCAPKPAR